MAKIAVDSAPASLTTHLLAKGDGWSVGDIVCTSGPHDRPYEERHSGAAIALVTAGSFQYRSGREPELMAPGSLMLGNPGQPFECGHEHGRGDRCIAFSYHPEFFARVASDAAAPPRFGRLRVPPLRELSPLAARASSALLRGSAGSAASWEETAVQLAARVLELDRGPAPQSAASTAAAMARVTRAVRKIDADPDGEHTLASLAREARLSPYHFLRTFQSLTGATPHQYLLRLRLRRAAVRIASGREKVVAVALESGFGDVSNFNRAFRAEFGVSPRGYRGTHLP